MTRELRGNGSQDRAPARLREQGRELARLLDQANHDYRQGLDEAGAWRRLRARHAQKRRRAVLVPLGAALAAAAAVAFWLLPLSRPGDGAVIGSAPPELVEPLGKLAFPAPVPPPSRPPVAFGKVDLPPARPSKLVPTSAALP